ncbi:lytic murein transglycosylase [Rhodoplanes roseus]|uniref:Lytic transglycosylase n=2 Tax=Rhodoplanes TaxID=29407 RepID=A0A327L2E2_9BRAD|nr:lytic murein transglycosylase [Rhodoplanes roseus]RAI44631.1 lytic transglycosylase [Rhodoplanes roseus]
MILLSAGRRAVVALATLVMLALAPAPLAAAPDAAFQQWLQGLWPDAQKLGVLRATFDQAIRGLEPDLSLPDLVIPGRAQAPPRGQAEFVQTPAEYLREKNLANLAATGRKLYEQHRATLQGIEERFGVPASVVLAIWGRETAFGSYKLPHDAMRVLATQAYYGRRKDMFRTELLYAMKMLQDGIPRADMRASWGGAVGLTQFLPSEVYKHGVDFDGDGKRDIFRSVPDALASAAQQLHAKGWQPGKHWAYEVKLPARGFDCTIADPDNLKPLRDWLAAGYVPAGGRRPAAADLNEPASLLQPAGTHGPSFLIMKNYYVIKDYNFSDLYVLFVGNVSDRIAGGGSFERGWDPVVQLRTADLEEMQKRLEALGLYRDKIDGKAGMRTRLALGAYEKANGLPLDCWPDASVLDHMRARAGR